MATAWDDGQGFKSHPGANQAAEKKFPFATIIKKGLYMDLPEPEVPEAPLYSAVHPGRWDVSARHSERSGDSSGILCLSVSIAALSWLQSWEKSGKIGSGRMRMAAESSGMDAGQAGHAEIAAAFGAHGLIPAARRCHPK